MGEYFVNSETRHVLGIVTFTPGLDLKERPGPSLSSGCNDGVGGSCMQGEQLKQRQWWKFMFLLSQQNVGLEQHMVPQSSDTSQRVLMHTDGSWLHRGASVCCSQSAPTFPELHSIT